MSNPLYPSDENVDDLESAAREAEWEDDTSEFLEKRKRRHQTDDGEDFL